jgi:hypothetical protein
VTFLELQNELLPAGVGNTARFKETQRESVKKWLNDRYAEVWGLEDWTFRYAIAPLTVSVGDDTPVMPTDFGIANQLWDAAGAKVPYVAPDTFFPVHLPSGTATGDPSRFTVINKQIYLDPTPGAASAVWNLYYEKALTLLVGDNAVPLLPPEHHYMLVHGAEATGQIRVQDFTYQFSEQRWQNQLAAMKRNYLVDQRGETAQWGAACWDG